MGRRSEKEEGEEEGKDGKLENDCHHVTDYCDQLRSRTEGKGEGTTLRCYVRTGVRILCPPHSTVAGAEAGRIAGSAPAKRSA